jgi:hypothetical protein
MEDDVDEVSLAHLLASVIAVGCVFN